MQQLGPLMSGPKGVHVASFFKGDSDRDSSMVPFVLDSIDRNAKCVYVLDRSTREQVVESLMKVRNVQSQLDAGQITFVPSSETYLKGGKFEMKRMLSLWPALEQQAISEGYGSLNATGEMTWSSKNTPGVENLREYEARINDLYPAIKANILCQYDEDAFESDILLDVMRAHPKVVVKGELCVNPYFTPTKELLSCMRGVVPKGVYDRVSMDILKRARLSTIHELELRDFRRANRRMAVLGGTALDDIQSQISIVDFYAELASESVKDETTRDYIEKISTNCSSLRKRIEFMRSYQQMAQSEFRWWDLADVLSSVGLAAGSHGVEIRYSVGKLRIWADGLFEKAVQTLVENTPDLKGSGDVVTVRSSELRSGMLVSIEHEGKGLPDQLKNKVFECGYRYGCSDGYGLFLAGEILESAGMTLRETGKPGRETRFEILVPRGKYSC